MGRKQQQVGIIQKQSIQGAVYTYMGIAIGFVSSGILFPRILSAEQIGLVNTLWSYALLFATIGTLGFTNATLRLFTLFRTADRKNNGFFVLLTIVSFAGTLLITLLFFLFRNLIIQINAESAPLFVTYIDLLLPFSILNTLFLIFDNYSIVLYKAVRGTVLKELVQRLFVFAGIVFYYYTIINFKQFLLVYLFGLLIPPLFLLMMIVYEKQSSLVSNWTFINRSMRRQLASVSFFGMLNSFSSNAVAQIDKIMLSSLSNLNDTGIYSTAFLFAALIRIPARPVSKIATSIIADSWKNNDTEQIHRIYKQSSLNLFIIACLLFVGIWANMDNIFDVITHQYEAGRSVILLIGFSGVIELASGVNLAILATSKHYRVITFFTAFLIIAMIGLNWFFIPWWGINGAALASLIATVLFNVLRVGYLYIKYRFMPYSLAFLGIIGISAVCLLVGHYLPKMPLLPDIIIRSGLMTLVFGLLIFGFKISPEINQIINNQLKRIGLLK